MKYLINLKEKTVEQILDEKQKNFYKKNMRDFNEESVPDSIEHKFESLIELFAFILPDKFDHKNFEQLEAEYLRLRLDDNAFVDIKTYMRINKLKERKTVYNRIERGLLEVHKQGKYVYVKDIE